jgi:hypothetical protein
MTLALGVSLERLADVLSPAEPFLLVHDATSGRLSEYGVLRVTVVSPL